MDVSCDDLIVALQNKNSCFKWYHYNLDGHHHNPDGYKDGIFTEKYGAVQVCFGKVVLLWKYK